MCVKRVHNYDAFVNVDAFVNMHTNKEVVLSHFKTTVRDVLSTI